MKKIFVSLYFLVLSAALMAQPTFDLGIKAGLNNSKVTFDRNDYNSESILKYHVGAFGRIGLNRIFFQPEAYFSAKGGKLGGSAFDVVTRFDFSVIDVPLLLGVKVIDGNNANVRFQGGPVFGIFTNKKIKPQDFFNPQFYKNNYVGYQYGVGADFFDFTIDLRMENTLSNIYRYPGSNLEGNNKTFMVSVGYAIF